MRFRGAFAMAATWALIAAGPGAAATIEVETDGDDFGNPVTAGVCTLREAVEAARTNQGFGGCPKGSKSTRDTITLVGNAFLTINGDTATNADGDLDHNRGGPLKILGVKGPGKPDITGNFSDRLLEVTRSKVRVVGVDLSGGGGPATNSGGAIRASNRGILSLAHVQIHDNIARLRGGAIACEGCRSLKLSGPFFIDDNLVQSSGPASGGAIWSNAPLTIDGVGREIPFPDAQSAIVNNTADPAGPMGGQGGGVYAGDDLTVSNTYIADNTALGNANGGAIYVPEQDGGARVELSQVTLEANRATGRGGGLDVPGTDTRLTVRRSAILGNQADPFEQHGNALGGGIFTQARTKIIETAIDGNTVEAVSASEPAAGGGISINSGNAPEPTRLRLVRTSVTNNDIIEGLGPRGAGVHASSDFTAVNSTIANNSAPQPDARGGGLYLFNPSGLPGGIPASGRIEFSTLGGNLAGDVGDAIYSGVSAPPVGDPLVLRATVIDAAPDACYSSSPGNISSAGYNVEGTGDAECNLDQPTDTTDADFLASASENGSPPVGVTTSSLDPQVRPLTSAFTNNTSSLLDRVPAGKCKVAGKPLRTDGRGAPRPAEGGCDTGALERTTCLGVFVTGANSDIGRNEDEQIQGSHATNDAILAQGGDDAINIYGGQDVACAGSGDDRVLAGENSNSADGMNGGPGIDLVSYNNGGPLVLDLAAGTGVGPNTGNDTLSGFENAQASEGTDTLLGSAGPNLLIGGGGVDEIDGRGGIDIIDAREPGNSDADLAIDCGPGDNSKEKAIVDPEDPEPISC